VLEFELEADEVRERVSAAELKEWRWVAVAADSKWDVLVFWTLVLIRVGNCL
jgi:hypothetical protein